MKSVGITSEFVQRTLVLSQAATSTVASLDFDHMGYFLNRYGVAAVQSLIAEVRSEILACLHDLSGVLHFSSADEIQLATTATNAELTTCLERAQLAVVRLGSAAFPSSRMRFGFTAAIAATGVVETTSPYQRLRLLDGTLRQILDNKSGIRGAVVIASPDAQEMDAAELADLIYQLTATEPARRNVLPVSRSRESGRSLLVISPQFCGATLRRHLELHGERGVTQLPDGETIGKLGFLNRLFGEHLTPNLLLDLTLQTLAEALERRETWRNASLLYCHTDTDAAPSVFDCLDRAVASLSQRLRDDLTIEPLRLALIPGEIAASGVCDDLSHHLFKVEPSSYSRHGSLAIYDYANARLDDFEAVHDRYRCKAIDLAEAEETLEGGTLERATEVAGPFARDDLG